VPSHGNPSDAHTPAVRTAHGNPSAHTHAHAPAVPLLPSGPMTRSRRKAVQARLSSLLFKELEREGLIEDAVLREKELRLVTLLVAAPCASGTMSLSVSEIPSSDSSPV